MIKSKLVPPERCAHICKKYSFILLLKRQLTPQYTTTVIRVHQNVHKLRNHPATLNSNIIYSAN